MSKDPEETASLARVFFLMQLWLANERQVLGFQAKALVQRKRECCPGGRPELEAIFLLQCIKNYQTMGREMSLFLNRQPVFKRYQADWTCLREDTCQVIEQDWFSLLHHSPKGEMPPETPSVKEVLPS